MATIARTSLLSVCALLLSLSLGGSAKADTFTPLPAAGGADKYLKVRVVKYQGGTNGEMVIEVQNASKKARRFAASGLFFVPKGDPEKAPQRLGAAGPFQEVVALGPAKNHSRPKHESRTKHQDRTMLRPGETKRLRLEVFCIDSHRSSPSSSTHFRVAKKLLPKKLRQEISVGARRLIAKNKGNVRKSKSAIQSHMWKTRDKKWIKLEGERKLEKVAPSRQQMRPREQRRHRPRQRVAPRTEQRRN